jgi:hypothetical protein
MIFIIFIMQFWLATATDPRATRRCMDVSYVLVLGHERAGSLLFQYIAVILYFESNTWSVAYNIVT